MILRLVATLALLCIGAFAAHADVTRNNYQSSTLTQVEQVTSYDDQFNQVDAHDGFLLEATAAGAPCTMPGTGGCLIWKVGTSYDCGFIWKQVSPFCGLKVYSSTDMVVWHFVQYLFDATGSTWQNYCAGIGGGGGCGSSKGLYNAANSNYVVWINQFGSNTTGTTDGMLVVTCTLSGGAFSCGSPTAPTGLKDGGGLTAVSGDFGLAQDGSGNGFIAFSAVQTTRYIYWQPLNSAFTDATGSSSTNANGSNQDEGVGAFFKGSTAYITYGPPCGFCSGGAALSYVSASFPYTSWTSPTQLNAGCQSQPRSVNVIVAGASTNYVYQADQWTDQLNPGNANEYLQPLTFTGSNINTFSCAQGVTLAGLTASATPSLPFTADQTSYPALFVNQSVIAGPYPKVLQTFVPAHANETIWMELGQALYGNALNGNVVVSIQAVDGSNNPTGSALASVTYTPSQLSFGQSLVQLFTASGLTPSSTYAIVVDVSAASQGAVTVATNTSGTSPYPTGVERFWTTPSGPWTTQTNYADLFASSPVPPGNPLR